MVPPTTDSWTPDSLGLSFLVYLQNHQSVASSTKKIPKLYVRKEKWYCFQFHQQLQSKALAVSLPLQETCHGVPAMAPNHHHHHSSSSRRFIWSVYISLAASWEATAEGSTCSDQWSHTTTTRGKTRLTIEDLIITREWWFHMLLFFPF